MKRTTIVASLFFFLFQLAWGQVRPLSTMVKQEHQAKIIAPVALEDNDSSPSQKSVLLAAVASLIVPGLGEWYAGSFESGKYQLIAEGGLWLSYAGFRMHANWIQQNAQTFAVQHAGASFGNKDDQYAVNIGNFLSTEEYNQAKLRNREDDLVYVANQYQWQWDSDANRSQFKDMRIRSATIRNNSNFIIGAIVVNHVLSAFFAGKKAAAYNRSLSMGENVELQAYPLIQGGRADGMALSMTAKF